MDSRIFVVVLSFGFQFEVLHSQFALQKTLGVVILNEAQRSEESPYRPETARFFCRNDASPVAKPHAVQAWLGPVHLYRTQNDTGTFLQSNFQLKAEPLKTIAHLLFRFGAVRE